jgi:hypothetical protein
LFDRAVAALRVLAQRHLNYQIIVSQGIGNSQAAASSTPEPALFALVGIALGCVVLLRRKEVGTMRVN